MTKNESGVPHFTLNLARVLIGLLFMLNGLAKLFGILGGQAQELGSQLWWAGAIESGTGLLVMLGLLTRPAAALAFALMVAAYGLAHFPRGVFPAANQNGGERAVLYGLWFLYFAIKGGGAFSLDGLMAARKRGKV